MQLFNGNEAGALMKIGLRGAVAQSPVLATHLPMLQHRGERQLEPGINGCQPAAPGEAELQIELCGAALQRDGQGLDPGFLPPPLR